ncbi:hypothetical protein [Pseudomonas sp. HY7a-MNA-CIBAN-0227]|uniref:hypothetical protein n=1 Tax=Pseudomonas sp. HY7a-MNA-CIBAN-0227 TaxID=3140474 RepID=UPI003327A8FB
MFNQRHFHPDMESFLKSKASDGKSEVQEPKLKVTRELLIDLFVAAKLDASQISAKLGLTKTYIKRKLKEFGLNNEPRNRIVLNITKEQLMKLYITERLSTAKIAEMYAVDRDVIVTMLARISKIQ